MYIDPVDSTFQGQDPVQDPFMDQVHKVNDKAELGLLKPWNSQASQPRLYGTLQSRPMENLYFETKRNLHQHNNYSEIILA